ncbi:class II D-tagatose-bisphosphate aldolase non-catalytic subunit [Plantactinospora soyae]|uniref:Tagatose-1,6-bisphosphate aldolase non-catalytic subunit AgaZ/GatZ n=1 Tax=Plantactinospora soyae TaxID=1544732 RepID=A0A927MCY5_9ACTN|nr:class II D-tagatose-bisphosphate aldolase, non-catalytic subunit [Plantactinospora soyae]MBE1490841.1 tagatose-1,6-bisphosphate aldolase non-catalytic subunit AgaZ/GatZ [Plantactinospora soyae]
MSELLLDLARRQPAGSAVGIPLVCSVHPLMIEAAVSQSFDDGAPQPVDATSNQVYRPVGYQGG